MKTLTVLLTAIVIGMTASLAHGQNQGLDVCDAGTLVSFEKINYQVGQHDAQGVEWDLELHTVGRQVLNDHQDT